MSLSLYLEPSLLQSTDICGVNDGQKRNQGSEVKDLVLNARLGSQIQGLSALIMLHDQFLFCKGEAVEGIWGGWEGYWRIIPLGWRNLCRRDLLREENDKLKIFSEIPS